MEYRFIYQLYAIRSDGITNIKTIKRKNTLSEERQRNLAGNFADHIAWTKNVQVILCGSNRMDPNDHTKFLDGFNTVRA